MESNRQTIFDIVVAIKGAGDLASGLACRLFNANICNIYLMELDKPLAVRRLVSFSEAVYKGKMIVEGVTGVLAKSSEDIQRIIEGGNIPVIVDSSWYTARTNIPDVLVDAIMAKKNIGTNITDAQLVIGLGPGFKAGKDVDLVIETKRGHNLGKVLRSGMAEANTSIPEEVNNFTSQRVVKSPLAGEFKTKYQIGDTVKKGEIIGQVGVIPIVVQIDGIIRGLIRSDLEVTEDMKLADVDPRGKLSFCYSVSDKARALGGAVLEAICGNFKF